MVIFTKKIRQLKQWTGEKFGKTKKTEKPTEIKNLQSETKSRFDGIKNIRDALNSHMKSLDESRNSSLGGLARFISAQSNFHNQNEFGTLLVTFGDGIEKLSDHQNQFANEIRMGLLMNLDALLNETKEFERLRKKLKNRRLDYDANNNKLQKSKKEDHVLEETVKTTKMKYDETHQKLEETMVTVSKQEIELIDPFIGFMEAQIGFYCNCLKTSETILQVLKEGKTDLKSIDFVAASFRREIEENESWLNSKDYSEEDNLPEPVCINNSSTENKFAKSVSTETHTEIEPIIMAKANYEFNAESKNELSLKKGDIIKVTKRIDEGWWVGICNGRNGMFPSNYVSVIDDNKVSKNDIKNLNSTLKSEDYNLNEDSKTLQSMAKPGFSYLPKGAPISFIGRRSTGIETIKEELIISSCGECKCEEFSGNVFKPGHCNNCFHKH